MHSNFTQLYLHLVWATWDRLPLIAPDIETPLYAAVAAKCRELQCHPLAIGGVPDHVHVLVNFPTTITIAEIVKGIKGSTSHLMTHEIVRESAFKWQGSYGAFTVSKSGVERVVGYIHLGRRAGHPPSWKGVGVLSCSSKSVIDIDTSALPNSTPTEKR